MVLSLSAAGSTKNSVCPEECAPSALSMTSELLSSEAPRVSFLSERAGAEP